MQRLNHLSCLCPRRTTVPTQPNPPAFRKQLAKHLLTTTCASARSRADSKNMSDLQGSWQLTSTSLAALGTAAIVSLGTLVVSQLSPKRMEKSELLYAPTAFNNAVMMQCEVLHSAYRRFWAIWNCHVETIWGAWFRKDPKVKYSRKILKVSEDGGTVALDYYCDASGQELPNDAPVVVLLPGLAGGSGCTYVQYCAKRAYEFGMRPIVFNSRGTAGHPITSPQFYSASFTGDIRVVVDHVASKYPNSRVLGIGWSLGGNILVNYLGEMGEKTPLSAAISLCNPFNLVDCDLELNKGMGRIYDKNLGNGMRKLFEANAHIFEGTKKIDVELAKKCANVRDFDTAITHRSFGWKNVDEYYKGSGSYMAIPKVKIPLLCIQANDDPIAVNRAIPRDAIKANPNCLLVTTPYGGHLGWVAGEGSPFGAPWSDLAAIQWLDAVLKELDASGKKGKKSNKKTNRKKVALSL